MSAEELRDSWQGRALRLARFIGEPYPAVLSMLASRYDDALPFLLSAVFGDAGVRTPFYCSEPKIDKAGRVVADMILRNGMLQRNTVVFNSTAHMEGAFRLVADRIRLTDAERIDMFDAVRAWVKADFRLDPTMDRRDPDAKRLTVH